MTYNMQPSADNALGSSAINSILAKGPFVTKSITIEQDAGAIAGEYVVGRLLNVDVDGKYHLLAAAETTVALAATTEVVIDNMLAADGIVPRGFVLAQPPIPGTVHLATTATGSATVVKELGTDNGEGVGVGADGWFSIDYETGKGVAYFTTATTDTHDLKAGYKHRTPDAADSAETRMGMPKVILAEDVTLASVIAGDVRTIAYVSGGFNKELVLSYSAGYEKSLQKLGIHLITSTLAA